MYDREGSRNEDGANFLVDLIAEMGGVIVVIVIMAKVVFPFIYVLYLCFTR